MFQEEVKGLLYLFNLEENKSFESLFISHCALSGGHARELLEVACQSTTLKHLSMRNFLHADSDHCIPLARSYSGVETLDISGSECFQLPTSQAALLRDLAFNTNLRNLSLSGHFSLRKFAGIDENEYKFGSFVVEWLQYAK
jgi:hypothetical protein